MRRGELWWVRQPASSGQADDRAERRRPYVVVTADAWNTVDAYPRVTLCPLTGAENVPRRYDTDVLLRKRDTGLPKDSVVRCVEVYTVFREALIERIGVVPGTKMREIEQALGLYLALPLGDPAQA